jgi:hypothetical protein
LKSQVGSCRLRWSICCRFHLRHGGLVGSQGNSKFYIFSFLTHRHTKFNLEFWKFF